MAAPSQHPGMGATLHDGGCTFRVWAPNADAVWVAGNFTNPLWDQGKIPMARDSNDPNQSGFQYWSLFTPGPREGSEYRFVIRNNGFGDGNFGGIQWRMDPYSRDATHSGGNSQVAADTFDWGSNGFTTPNWNEAVIYELHIGTFNAQPGRIGNFDEAIARLDYLRDLGVNVVQVLPAEDFDTETSMGYNPALPFAIDDAYGRPRAVQAFVKEANARGIAVIFDVVYNHFGPEGLGECLWEFDGWHRDGFGGIYLYNDDRASIAWGEKNRVDFGRPQVRQYIRDNAMMWLHEYHASGLRLDSVVNIRRIIDHDGHDHGDNGEGWSLLQWINDEKNREQSWKLTIAEDLQNNEFVTRDTGSGGAGFNAQWDSRFRSIIRDGVTAGNDDSRNMGAIGEAIGKAYLGGGMFQRVIYVESHDEATDLRLPDAIWRGNATSWHARKRSTLAAAIVMTSPGIPMIFQGQEFLEFNRWSDKQPMDWEKAGRFGGIRQLYKELIQLRRNWFNNTRGLHGANINIFHINYEAKIIAFHRWNNGGPGDDVVVVLNFSTFPFANYNIGFPRGGTWYLRFNSDWNGYSGDFGNLGYDTTALAGDNQGMHFNGNVGIGAYSALIYSQ